MFTESSDDKPLQERYDMLKALCRQQILVNETLKFEISKLRNLVRKISAERTLLMDELLENHSSCRSSSEVDSKANIKLKSNTQITEKRPHSQDDRTFTDAKKLKSGNLWNAEENLDGREDSFGSNLEIEATVPHELSHFSAKGRLPYQVSQQQTSPNMNKSTISLINSTEDKSRHFITDSNWHSSNQTGSSSPPTLPMNSRLSQSPNQSYDPLPQKTSKLGSLVTNSSVSSNTPSASFNLPQRNTALNQTKYLSVGNRSVKVIGSGIPNTVGRVDQPTGGMLKAAISPPISPNIRLSTSSVSNQRIMIQPNKGTVRSIIVPRTQHNISDAPLKYGYTG